MKIKFWKIIGGSSVMSLSVCAFLFNDFADILERCGVMVALETIGITFFAVTLFFSLFFGGLFIVVGAVESEV